MEVRTDVERLTEREVEIVLLLGRDRLTYKDAAAALRNHFDPERKLSHATVKVYATRIFEKLDGDGRPKTFLIEFYWTNRDELERVAQERGLT